ncbi:MAG: hypothetical protein ACE5I8_00375 [Thermodesulfobacteriota bacterium]
MRKEGRKESGRLKAGTIEIGAVSTMPLMRAYSLVDGEGKVIIPRNVRRQAMLNSGHLAEIKVVRIKGTNRNPHVIIHNQGCSPYISPLEVIMMHECVKIDEEGKIVLVDGLRSEAKLDIGHIVEMKIQGAASKSWIVVHNRGPGRLTTLQERLGRRKARKQKRTMPLEY